MIDDGRRCYGDASRCSVAVTVAVPSLLFDNSIIGRKLLIKRTEIPAKLHHNSVGKKIFEKQRITAGIRGAVEGSGEADPEVSRDALGCDKLAQAIDQLLAGWAVIGLQGLEIPGAQ